MKKIAGLALVGYLFFNSLAANAQSYAESALLFTRTSPGGSARVQGLGGAQVSLGGDYSSAYSNPAGLGMFNRSEITFTPGYSTSNTSSNYIGNNSSASASNVIIPGFSAVFHKEKNSGGLLSGTFGISFNRTNNFNNQFQYSGVNRSNSIIDYFISDATGTDASQFDGPNANNNYTPALIYNSPTGLAYDSYLFNATGPNSTQYNSDIPITPTTQHEVVQTSGRQTQFSFGYGVNLNDKVFLGATLGIPSINYTSKKTYTETSPQDTLLTSLSLSESLTTKGSGINLTVGAIFRPVDMFQFGVSIATPTGYFSLTDNYTASLTTIWNKFPYAAPATPAGTINGDLVTNSYQFVTPWRFSGGATFFIEKHGFITADLEYINYAGSKYSNVQDYYNTVSGNSFDDDGTNAAIKSHYKSVLNLRLGAEIRLGSYRVRGGFGLMSNPYKPGFSNSDATIQNFSAGAGYRTTKWYVDIAGIYGQGNTSYGPYSSSPIVSNQNKNTTVMVTVGFPLSVQ